LRKLGLLGILEEGIFKEKRPKQGGLTTKTNLGLTLKELGKTKKN